MWQADRYMNMPSVMKNKRLCLALTGSIPEEIQELELAFSWNLVDYRASRRSTWIRRTGAGQKGVLKTPLEKLVAVLIYLKCYPTFDLLGFILGMNRSNACRDTHMYLKVLEQALKRKLVLPARKISSVEEFLSKFPEARSLFIDGTERRVQKPVGQKRSKRLYSGKKKATTRKNILMTDATRKILVLTQTKSGRRHDKRLTDKAHLIRTIPAYVEVGVDTGFQGMQKEHPNILMPKKSTKKHPITTEEKEWNRLISSVRVIVEHAIGGVKRMRSTSDIYRNKIPNTDDLFMLLSAGLWNYHLSMR